MSVVQTQCLVGPAVSVINDFSTVVLSWSLACVHGLCLLYMECVYYIWHVSTIYAPNPTPSHFTQPLVRCIKMISTFVSSVEYLPLQAIGRYSLGHGKGDGELYTEELREDGTEPGQADPWETLGEISEQQPQPIKRWKSMPTIAAKIKPAGAASPKCCDDEGHVGFLLRVFLVFLAWYVLALPTTPILFLLTNLVTGYILRKELSDNAAHAWRPADIHR